MPQNRCPYCDTPLSDDRDRDGLPFCSCPEFRLNQLETETIQLRKAVIKAKSMAETLNKNLKQLQEKLDKWEKITENLNLY